MSKHLSCPNCKRRGNTFLIHNLVDNLYHSWCKSCDFRSIPTPNYDAAIKWLPTKEKRNNV